MRITLPRLIALSAVLVIPVGCGIQEPAASNSASPVAVQTTPTASPTPVELTKATFAPRVLGALLRRGTFRVQAQLIEQGAWDTFAVTANVRIKGDVIDLAVDEEGDQMVRIGQIIYIKDPELTEDNKRPWAKLDLASDEPDMVIAGGVADELLSDSLFHQMIGGAAHATSFKRGGQRTFDGVDAQEYILMVDLKKATAVNALGDYLDKTDAKTLPKDLSLSIWVDANDLPHRIEFNLADAKDGPTAIQATFSQFGKKLPIAAPPAAKIGKLKLS